jgi:hypothetical protein
MRVVVRAELWMIFFIPWNGKLLSFFTSTPIIKMRSSDAFVVTLERPLEVLRLESTWHILGVRIDCSLRYRNFVDNYHLTFDTAIELDVLTHLALVVSTMHPLFLINGTIPCYSRLPSAYVFSVRSLARPSVF